MIKINLLPQIGKAKKSTKAPVIFVIVVVIALLIVGIVWLYQNGQITSMQNQIAQLEKRKKDLEPKMEAIQAQLQELEQKDKAISSLAGKERLLWSQKLNELSNLVPDNVKFTRIYIETKDGKSSLKLEGVSYSNSGEDRVALVGKLMDALKNDKLFFNNASGNPNFGDVEFVETISEEDKAKTGGLMVGKFVIKMEII